MIKTSSHNRNWISRTALLFCGAILCFAGTSGLFDPTMLSGNAVLAPDGVTSIRVDYGGFHLGLGLFALLGGFRTNLLNAGLIATSITMTLVVAMRLIGMQIDGMNEAQTTILIFEATPFLISLFGLGFLHFGSKSGDRT